MSKLKSVMLLHQGYGPDHLDWLLEAPAESDFPDELDRALTFKLPWPFQWSAQGPVEVQLNFPHRHHYFEYEGPVSGDRGTVRRWFDSWHEPELWSETEILTLISDKDLTLKAHLQAKSDGGWTLELAEVRKDA